MAKKIIHCLLAPQEWVERVTFTMESAYMLRKMVLATIISSSICSLFFVYPLVAAPKAMSSASSTVQKDIHNSTQRMSSNSTGKNTLEDRKNTVNNSHNSSIKTTNNSTLPKVVGDSSDTMKTKMDKSTAKEQKESNAEQTKDPDNTPLALILKSIQLSQGEDGSELWRLNAKAAQMEQQEENFLVESPQLTYIMKPNNTELHVSSDKGKINQKDQVLFFKDNVLITHMDNSIKGNLLVYNGTQKTMTFPEGGVFVGKKINGSAGVVLWHLDTQKIEAKDNVSITFSSDAS